jgi:hypothetical protein
MKGNTYLAHLLSTLNSTNLAYRITIAFTAFYLAFLPPGIYSVDGNSMLAVAEALATNHNCQVPPSLGLQGIGGRWYSNWYPLLSFVCLPFVSLALLVSRHISIPFHYLAAIMAVSVNAFVTAATAGFVALLSQQLGATVRSAWLASLSFGFGTVALVYARTFYAEPLLALLVAASLYFAFRLNFRSAAVCSFLAAFAVLAKPSGIFVGLIISVYLFAKKRTIDKGVVLPATGSIIGLVSYMAYNQLRFGHALQFGPPWNFYPSGLWSGFPGLLFSFGWGLVWYSPPVVAVILGLAAGVRRQRTLEMYTIIGIVTAFLVFHSIYFNWPAGWSWGPRYLVPAIPGLCAVLGLVDGKGRRAIAILTLLGFLINAPTLFSFYERYFAELKENGIAVGPSTAWSLSRAPMVHIWPAGFRQVDDAIHSDVRELFDQRGEPANQIKDSRALRIIALWWWVLPLARIPRWVGILVAIALTVASILILLTGARADDAGKNISICGASS